MEPEDYLDMDAQKCNDTYGKAQRCPTSPLINRKNAYTKYIH